MIVVTLVILSALIIWGLTNVVKWEENPNDTWIEFFSKNIKSKSNKEDLLDSTFEDRD